MSIAEKIWTVDPVWPIAWLMLLMWRLLAVPAPPAPPTQPESKYVLVDEFIDPENGQLRPDFQVEADEWAFLLLPNVATWQTAQTVDIELDDAYNYDALERASPGYLNSRLTIYRV